MPSQRHTLTIFAVVIFLLIPATIASAQAAGTSVPSDALQQALQNLSKIQSSYLSEQRLNDLKLRLEAGTLDDNDDNLLCIGALSIPFATAFGVGLVPNPPWDYVLGQMPAYTANLALKFCRPVLHAPTPIEKYPNVDTEQGSQCAYEFSQPIIAGTRSDFLGVPLESLGNWTFTETPDSRGLGTPTVFHYNTGVEVRLILPGEAPPGFLQEVPAPEFVARIGPLGITAPDNPMFSTLGCLLEGTIPFSNEGGPCPVDLDRKITLPVGSHTINWRAETRIGLLDTLPPIYVPGKPPGSKSEAAKAILRNIYEAAREEFAGSFLEDYPSGVVNLQTQTVDIYDTEPPVLQFSPPAMATFRVEAQEPGGQSTRGFSQQLRASIVATDACGRTPQVTRALPPFYPLGTHQVTWVARDAGPAPGGGVNETTLMQTIIVEDTQPPQVAAPPPVVVETDSAPLAVDLGSPKVFDVADLEAAVEYQGPSTFPLGTTVVQWRATDASGNTSPWVEQKVTVKSLGSNQTPVADNSSAAGLSFDEVQVTLTGSDADHDDLYFYIDQKPQEGFFVAPLLPTFVDDLRVQAQFDPGAVCQAGQPLPPQNYVWRPSYITTDDDGVTYVIDRLVECDLSGSTGISSDDTRIAQIGPDGALIASINLGNTERPEKLAFHPGNLPGYETPFIYWINPSTDRLRILDQSLSGSVETIRIDFLPAGTVQPGDPVDATIDHNGVLSVSSTDRVYVFDFLTRDSGNNAVLFLGRLGRPASETERDFGTAFDIDSDQFGDIYVADFQRDRIYKFAAPTLDRTTQPATFQTGAFIGWLGYCDSDMAPGSAAACDVANQRSIGYSCTDDWCGASQTHGDLPGQLDFPRGIAIDPNNILYVADRGNDRIQRFTPEGFYAGQAQSDCEAVHCFVIGQFGVADDVSVNSSSFYVLDSNTDILHIFSADPVTMTGPTTGHVTYRSNNNFVGEDTFSFYASDGLRTDGELVRSNTAMATMQISANQRPPFATPAITAIGAEDTVIAIALDGSDPDIGDVYPWEPLETLTAQLHQTPQHGEVVINGLSASYTPDPDWSGVDEFAFTVSDGVFLSAAETVVVGVNPVPDPPRLTMPDRLEDLIAGVGYPWEFAAGVEDPDADDSLALVVDWGDGTVEPQGEILNDGTVTGPLLDSNASGEGMINGQHIYQSVGQRRLQVCVTDSDGLAVCDHRWLDVITATDLNVFEVDPQTEVPFGTPVSFEIGVSNFAGDNGAGSTATDVVLTLDLDIRVQLQDITGASCTQQAQRLTCALPDLAPVARNPQDAAPLVQHQVTLTVTPDASLTQGQQFSVSAQIAAQEPNIAKSKRSLLSRVVVANGDFVVQNTPADSTDEMPGDGSCRDADNRCTLRAAIQEANQQPGSTIIALSAQTYRLSLGPLPITSDITLIGLGPGLTEIISDNDARLFEIQHGASLTLSGTTLTGGDPIAGSGGLIENFGTLHISDSVLQNGDSLTGGAIYSDGTLTVVDSSFVNNQATRGGGSGGAIANFGTGTASLENVLLFNNSALAGGAIASDASSATLELNHATITGNSAQAVGAGLFGNYSDLPMATLENTILAGNVTVQPPIGVCWNQLISAGNNLIADDRESCPLTTMPSDLVDVDARLQNMIRRVDGRVLLRPETTSPAVDHIVAPCLSHDLIGMERPQDGNHDAVFGCDIGAFEQGVGVQLNVSPALLDFGDIAAGDVSATRTITLSNSGNLAADIVAFSEPLQAFRNVGGSCPPAPFQLPPDSQCTRDVQFAPLDEAPSVQDLLVISTANAPEQHLQLRGNAPQPQLVTDTQTIALGDHPLGQSSAIYTLQISNTGEGELHIGSTTIASNTDGAFALETGGSCEGATLSFNDSCIVNIRFSPQAPGVRQAHLQLISNDPLSPHMVTLTGSNDVIHFSTFEYGSVAGK